MGIYKKNKLKNVKIFTFGIFMPCKLNFREK